MEESEERIREKLWHTRKRSKCKSCGAAIIWSQTSKEKWIPLDIVVERRAIYYTRRLVMDSLISGKDEAKLDRIEIVPTYTVHFQTCPNANHHRKKNGNS
jgi:hypothetical protein